MFLRLVALARARVELAEAEVTVGDERAHAARLGEGQRLTVVGLAALTWREQWLPPHRLPGRSVPPTAPTALRVDAVATRREASPVAGTSNPGYADRSRGPRVAVSILPR